MCPQPDPVPPSEPKLLDQLRGRLRVKHYSIRTEQAYVDWVRRFVLFHDKRHPRGLGQIEVETFLTDLAVRRRVSASTQNQAKSAILFLYKEVINKELPWLNGVVAARVSQRLPVVLTVEEVNAALGRLRGTSALVTRLLYGSGLRILECLRLRVKDIDFASREILVRDGKGAKDRVTMLPESLIEPLRRHLERVRELHGEDLRPVTVRCICPMRSIASTRTPARSGCGSTYSPPRDCPKIRAPKSSGAIMPTKSRFSVRCSRRYARPASINPPHRTPCGILSPPISCNRATTSPVRDLRAKAMPFYYVYVLVSGKDGNWYTGYTVDLRARLKQHQEGKSRSTQSRGPWTLIYYEASVDVEDARARERYLKSGMGKRYLRNRLRNYLTALRSDL